MYQQLRKGQVLNGRYQILRFLGSGGMSAVYLAKDLKRGIRVAVKKDTGGEGQLLSELRHPGIVSFLSSFQNNGERFLVEEYIEGKTLSYLVNRMGVFAEEEVCEIGLSLCSILIYLHNQDPPVIYRDLKPDNIMLDKNGRICLVDFGTARKYVPGKKADTVSFGTVGYAPPEQYEGSRRQSDERVDLFALGRVLYFLLTGDDPARIPEEQWEQRLFSHFGDSAFANLLLWLTEEDPEQRIMSAEDAAEEIRRIRSDGFYENVIREPNYGESTGRFMEKEFEDEFDDPEDLSESDSRNRCLNGKRSIRNGKKRYSSNPAALLLTFLAILIYAGGFLLGLGKASLLSDPLDGGFQWITAAVYWGISMLSGTLVMGMGQIVKLLHEIRGMLTDQ